MYIIQVVVISLILERFFNFNVINKKSNNDYVKVILPLIKYYFEQMNNLKYWDTTMYIKMVMFNYNNEYKNKPNNMTNNTFIDAIYSKDKDYEYNTNKPKYVVLTIRLSTHDTNNISVKENSNLYVKVLESVKKFEEDMFGKSHASEDDIQFIEDATKAITFDTTSFTKMFLSKKYRMIESDDYSRQTNDVVFYNNIKYYKLYYPFIKKTNGSIICKFPDKDFAKNIDNHQFFIKKYPDDNWDFKVSNSLYNTFIKELIGVFNSDEYKNFFHSFNFLINECKNNKITLEDLSNIGIFYYFE